jgi:hypothetical protein
VMNREAKGRRGRTRRSGASFTFVESVASFPRSGIFVVLRLD